MVIGLRAQAFRVEDLVKGMIGGNLEVVGGKGPYQHISPLA